jgi:hypothetical protein
MSTKRVLVSMGSIPAKLDSVKYIGNRFKGGLALKTAQYLATSPEFEVIAIKWKYADVRIYSAESQPGLAFSDMKVVDIEDINEYYSYVCDPNNLFDAYVLAGAVANLMPVEPFKGKFPSHNYREGQTIDIPFTIAPRIIDKVKQIAPRAALVGYKLFDGTEEELIHAARETLRGSKANIVFANTPAMAKTKKLALTQDGSVIPMTFDSHVKFIRNLINQKWFTSRQVNVNKQWFASQTVVVPLVSNVPMDEETAYIAVNYPRTNLDDQIFGTFAVRDERGFWTTSRGKSVSNSTYVHVNGADFDRREVFYEGPVKPTLNASTLAKIFDTYPEYKIILHNHKQLPGLPGSISYRFPGTLEEAESVVGIDLRQDRVNFEYHGYLAMFRDFQSAKAFIERGEG